MKNSTLFIFVILIFSSFTFAENLPLGGEIRKVNFKNFTYQPFCAGEETTEVTVKDGEFSEEKKVDGYTDYFYFNVFAVEYGDVTADGNEDAIILTTCNTGGTGQFSEGFVYEMKAGKPSLVTRISGGDRAYGGLTEARAVNGLLVVESNDVGEEGGACCPEFVITTRYKISGGKLVESGKAERRELYPAQRVSFPKGASSTTFNVKFTADETRKRFLVGARKGQTLRVFTPDSKVFLEVIKGDAESNANEGKITAKLNETGDFVIQVQHFTETESEISLTIEIK